LPPPGGAASAECPDPVRAEGIGFGVDPAPTLPFPSPLTPMAVEIKIRKGEAVDKALRRLKKKVDRENIIKDARAKRGFEKPTTRRRRKRKVKDFNAYLRKKWENK
jgi:small subunit ribosomal protein S21